MSNTKREYPCKDWWWIDPEIGGNHLSKNRTTRALEEMDRKLTILSFVFEMVVIVKLGRKRSIRH
jgi:hypothetical protein